MIRIDIVRLLEFYDVYKPERAVHVTALNSFLGADLVLGIVRHYFEGKDVDCRIDSAAPASAISRHRLDRWLRITEGEGRVFYQTEVKNWTVYTQGVPRTLSPGMSARELNRYAHSMYRKQWNEKTGTFIDYDNLAKVLMPMNQPEDFDGEAGDTVRPLVCYWYPITPSSRLKLQSHFFTLKCGSTLFPETDIFSVSLYLRSLAGRRITHIDINPGRFMTTLSHLKTMLNF